MYIHPFEKIKISHNNQKDAAEHDGDVFDK
jgi:hypothetical protein